MIDYNNNRYINYQWKINIEFEITVINSSEYRIIYSIAHS